MNDTKYFLCDAGSLAEKECAAFLLAWESGEKALCDILEKYHAVAWCGERWRFPQGFVPNPAFQLISRGLGDLPDTYRLNRRSKDGKAISAEIERAQTVFPDRLSFHGRIAGFPVRCGRFTCAYPARLQERFYIVVPLNGWDGETRPPKGAVEVKASAFFLAKEKAEEAERKRRSVPQANQPSCSANNQSSISNHQSSMKGPL